ncbi:MAG: chromosomal replication initiator protein DnaA [Neisseria sp.]|nr:chromosomal replication initiator protein DnaA [Neisseria sp.]
MTLAEFWPLCLRRLRETLTLQQFDTWIAPLTVGEEGGAWVVYAKNQFACNMLQNQFAGKIDAVRAEIAPEKPALLFKAGRGMSFNIAPAAAHRARAAGNPQQDELPLNGDKPPEAFAPAEAPKAKPVKPAKRSAQEILAERIKNLPVRPEILDKIQTGPKAAETAKPAAKSRRAAAAAETQEQWYAQTNLSPEYTFDTLVKGNGNSFAFSAAEAIAASPGGSYNPFFLYGSTGLGKTHLVQAIGNALLKRNPKARVRYMHSDEYISSFIKAVRANAYEQFKERYRQYDLMIIDDIQFIKGKDRTMEEFFYLYNHFHATKRQLVMTCDVLPSHIKDMDDRLKSRFSWGLTTQLEPPELEMRVAILQRKAESVGVPLDDEVAFLIAKHIRSNVRELEGAFKRLQAAGGLMHRRIDVDLVNETLGGDIFYTANKAVTPETIMDAVAKHYGIRTADLIGKKRSRNIARPRQVAMSLTKELVGLSLPAIGGIFGGRDHTTVMYGIRTVADLRKSDAALAADYEKLLLLMKD